MKTRSNNNGDRSNTETSTMKKTEYESAPCRDWGRANDAAITSARRDAIEECVAEAEAVRLELRIVGCDEGAQAALAIRYMIRALLSVEPKPEADPMDFPGSQAAVYEDGHGGSPCDVVSRVDNDVVEVIFFDGTYRRQWIHVENLSPRGPVARELLRSQVPR